MVLWAERWLGAWRAAPQLALPTPSFFRLAPSTLLQGGLGRMFSLSGHFSHTGTPHYHGFFGQVGVG